MGVCVGDGGVCVRRAREAGHVAARRGRGRQAGARSMPSSCDTPSGLAKDPTKAVIAVWY